MITAYQARQNFNVKPVYTDRLKKINKQIKEVSVIKRFIHVDELTFGEVEFLKDHHYNVTYQDNIECYRIEW